MRRGPLRYVVAIGLVALAAFVAYYSGARIEARLMLLAIVGAALLGSGPGLLAVVVSTIVLNVVFQNQSGSIGLAGREEIIGLVSFVAVAYVIGSLVSRDRASRRQAELGEQEALLRVAIADQLLAEGPTQSVADAAATAITDTFGLSACTLDVGTLVGRATATPDGSKRRVPAVVRRRLVRRPTRTITVETAEATLVAVTRPEAELTRASEDVLAALVSAIGTAFARAELERSAADARIDAEVNRGRAAFFAAAGHNLRTPLAAVDASVSALLDTRAAMNPEQEELLLQTIAGETSRLGRMVGKVLAQSQIHGGTPQPDLEPVDLEGMAQVAVGRLGPLAGSHRFELDVPPETGPLWMDVTMLEQILLNLLENAARFAPPGTVITIDARNEGDEVVLRVIDRGPGVEEAERERIFDQFHRVGYRTEGEGTGLGLSIVRALVEAHGGTVHCEPTPGGGATFVARFPGGDRTTARLLAATVPAMRSTADGGTP